MKDREFRPTAHELACLWDIAAFNHLLIKEHPRRRGEALRKLIAIGYVRRKPYQRHQKHRPIEVTVSGYDALARLAQLAVKALVASGWEACEGALARLCGVELEEILSYLAVQQLDLAPPPSLLRICERRSP